MKNKTVILLLIVSFVYFFSSCKKDETDELNFSKLSVEENKKIIENTGYDLIDEMENMENLDFVDVFEAFVSFSDKSDPFEGNEDMYNDNYKKELGFSILKSVSDCSETGIKGIKDAMTDYEDEPETIQEMYDILKGVYEWNSYYEEWEYSSNSNTIEFRFPSSEYGTTNNASYTILYEGVLFENTPIDEDYNGDFPKHVTYTLKVDGQIMSNFESNFGYDNNGYPTTADFILELEGYQFKLSSTNNNNQKSSVEFSLKNQNTVIAMIQMQVNGNWSEDNIEQNTKYYTEYWDGENWTWVEEEVDKDDYYDYYETDFHKLITNGNASAQLMNIKVTGNVDVEKLVDGLYDLDESYKDYNDEEFAKAETNLINKYTDLTLINVENNEIIAKCEAYVALDEDIDSYYAENYYAGLRFVFADGSKIDVETYFDEGFDDLFEDFEDFFDDMEDDWDDY